MSQYEYFVEPKDAFTNEVISNAVCDQHFPAATCRKEDKDGISHNLWICDLNEVKQLIASKKEKDIDFAIWVRVLGKDVINPSTRLNKIANRKKRNIRGVNKLISEMRSAAFS